MKANLIGKTIDIPASRAREAIWSLADLGITWCGRNNPLAITFDHMPDYIQDGVMRLYIETETSFFFHYFVEDSGETIMGYNEFIDEVRQCQNQ